MASRKSRDSKSVASESHSSPAIPMQVWRSDGSTSIEPIYEKVDEGDRVVVEWLNKLGQALAQELMPNSADHYFLEEFPTHYHLRFYQADKGQKHYYLYGYPQEKSTNAKPKYYRSPNAFIPHLLWLSGNSEDRGDCACEFCSGSKPISSKQAKIKGTAAMHIVAPSPIPNTNIGTPKSSASHSPQQLPPANPSTHTKSTMNSQPSHQPSLSNAQPPVSDHIPQVQQIVHGVPSSFPTVPLDEGALFRSGEVVWFRNNHSWRIGMVTSLQHGLRIIPFGHPLYQTQEVIKEEADLRPFLTFSIPQINSALAQEFGGKALSTMDWQVLQKRFVPNNEPPRAEGLAIEATKLAATRVDHCFSTFNQLQGSLQGYEIFGGVFFGAEKICVGEAVGIKIPRDHQGPDWEPGMPVLMVVQHFRVSQDNSQALSFEGSVWRLKHVLATQQSQPPNQIQLPSTMLGEKEFRDSLLQSRGWCVEWAPVFENITYPASSVRGRFYETQRLTPILNPDKYQEMLRLQQVEDIQTLLNNHGDSSGPHVGRVMNRAHAVAGAVPAGVATVLGPDVLEA
ncbi:hypothetical protein F5Y16DRAFT_399260 [Xylariaceae sp. FL0255]|nr:hypothetical protein F5Y16DRAFT_399260 [Xylariaceae sp. FL0255]